MTEKEMTLAEAAKNMLEVSRSQAYTTSDDTYGYVTAEINLKAALARESEKKVETRYPEAACKDCGLPYEKQGADIHFPLADWLKIEPSGSGYLCGACISLRANALPDVTGIEARLCYGPYFETILSERTKEDK